MFILLKYHNKKFYHKNVSVNSCVPNSHNLFHEKELDLHQHRAIEISLGTTVTDPTLALVSPCNKTYAIKSPSVTLSHKPAS